MRENDSCGSCKERSVKFARSERKHHQSQYYIARRRPILFTCFDRASRLYTQMQTWFFFFSFFFQVSSKRMGMEWRQDERETTGNAAGPRFVYSIPFLCYRIRAVKNTISHSSNSFLSSSSDLCYWKLAARLHCTALLYTVVVVYSGDGGTLVSDAITDNLFFSSSLFSEFDLYNGCQGCLL